MNVSLTASLTEAAKQAEAEVSRSGAVHAEELAHGDEGLLESGTCKKVILYSGGSVGTRCSLVRLEVCKMNSNRGLIDRV